MRIKSKPQKEIRELLSKYGYEESINDSDKGLITVIRLDKFIEDYCKILEQERQKKIWGS